MMFFDVFVFESVVVVLDWVVEGEGQFLFEIEDCLICFDGVVGCFGVEVGDFFGCLFQIKMSEGLFGFWSKVFCLYLKGVNGCMYVLVDFFEVQECYVLGDVCVYEDVVVDFDGCWLFEKLVVVLVIRSEGFFVGEVFGRVVFCEGVVQFMVIYVVRCDIYVEFVELLFVFGWGFVFGKGGEFVVCYVLKVVYQVYYFVIVEQYVNLFVVQKCFGLQFLCQIEYVVVGWIVVDEIVQKYEMCFVI